MRLPNLLVTLELEDERLSRVRSARESVDTTRTRYHKARSELERLERLEGSSRGNPLALERARNELTEARLEHSKARRALMGSMA